MIFTRATHIKGSLQPIPMICPKVAGRSLAESVNLPARCCTLLSSAVKMAELEQQLRSDAKALVHIALRQSIGRNGIKPVISTSKR